MAPQDNSTFPFNPHSQLESTRVAPSPSISSEWIEMEKIKKSDRYHVLETLGEGGMGVVQRVQDTLLGREVAFKKIKQQNFKELTPKEQMRLWRLIQEAKITAILEHPNIVPLYDMQQLESGETYFIMRKVEGKTLGQLLQENIGKVKKGEPYLAENKLFPILFKICDAMAYAHSRGIIHRDLKPDNIMVGRFGEVYVMDWGIAKNSNDTQNEKIEWSYGNEEIKTVGGMGTPGYMPPEQRENAASATPESDIYALGKILRQCYVGKSPYQEFQEMLKFLSPRVKKTSNSPSKEPMFLPRDILAIVEKATAENRLNRYQTMKEMVNDLERYLNRFRVSAREYSLGEILWKWTKRQRKNIAIVFVIFFLVFSFFLGWNEFQRKQLLQQHQNRLSHWIDRLMTSKKGDRELALLEIGKMSEPEILTRLLHLLEEGTACFLKSDLHTKQMKNFYMFIVDAIGQIGNPEAGPFLVNALMQMKDKLAPLLMAKRSLEEEQFMVSLAVALKNCKARNSSHLLLNIQGEMGTRGLFSRKTNQVYMELGMSDTAESLKVLDPVGHFTRGNIQSRFGEYRQALESFDKAIAGEYLSSQLFLFTRGDYARALHLFNEVIRLKPDHQTALNKRGLLKAKIKDFEGAKEDLLRFQKYASEANPKHSQIPKFLQQIENALKK